jgi:hypothetical protein
MLYGHSNPSAFLIAPHFNIQNCRVSSHNSLNDCREFVGWRLRHSSQRHSRLHQMVDIHVTAEMVDARLDERRIQRRNDRECRRLTVMPEQTGKLTVKLNHSL